MPYSISSFHIDGMMMRFSAFIPRFYNLCKSFGFRPGQMMPSRAFCSDESQGFPVILIAKHFGTFPFNHGRVGGIVSTGRNGPHSHHGRDLVIIQASHVGYDPDSKEFGKYRRLQTDQHEHTASCGKIAHVLEWYQQEYDFAQNSIFLSRLDGEAVLIIDNYLSRQDRTEGLLLNLDKLLAPEHLTGAEPLHMYSTAKAYRPAPALVERFSEDLWQPGRDSPIGDRLSADLFSFRHDNGAIQDEQLHLERNLGEAIPRIITSPYPSLAAAQINTQVEFDHTFRAIVKEHSYQGRNLAFISGVNIDISPSEGQIFPLTKFIPWAAYIQTEDGQQLILEQAELVSRLSEESSDNPDQIDLEVAIGLMEQVAEVRVELNNP